MHFELGRGLMCSPVGSKIATMEISEENLRTLVDELHAHDARFPSRAGDVARLTLPPSPSHSSTNSPPRSSFNLPWYSQGARLALHYAVRHQCTGRSGHVLACAHRAAPGDGRHAYSHRLKLTSQGLMQPWVDMQSNLRRTWAPCSGHRSRGSSSEDVRVEMTALRRRPSRRQGFSARFGVGTASEAVWRCMRSSLRRTSLYTGAAGGGRRR